MQRLLNVVESEPIGFYNGAAANKRWQPIGIMDATGLPACLCMSVTHYTYQEFSAEGYGAYTWEPGQIGFFPHGFARQMDYTMPGAAVTYISLPNSLLIQAMPIGDWQVHRKKADPLTQYLICAASSLKADDDPLLIDSIIVAAVHRVAQWHTGPYPASSKKNEPQIRRSVEYLNDNLTEPVTLQDLASVACMSPFHFSRQFSRVTGRSPHAYMTHKRVERAKAMLMAGALSVASIAYACGFGSQAHFCRQFKVHEGHSPTEYRRTASSAKARSA